MRNQDSWFVEGILDAGWGTRRISTTGLKAILSGPTTSCGKVSAILRGPYGELLLYNLVRSNSWWFSDICDRHYMIFAPRLDGQSNVQIQLQHEFHCKLVRWDTCTILSIWYLNGHLAMFSNTAKSFPSFSVILCSVVESPSSKTSPSK